MKRSGFDGAVIVDGPVVTDAGVDRMRQRVRTLDLLDAEAIAAGDE
jgi:hypothetical protein